MIYEVTWHMNHNWQYHIHLFLTPSKSSCPAAPNLTHHPPPTNYCFKEPGNHCTLNFKQDLQQQQKVVLKVRLCWEKEFLHSKLFPLQRTPCGVLDKLAILREKGRIWREGSSPGFLFLRKVMLTIRKMQTKRDGDTLPRPDSWRTQWPHLGHGHGGQEGSSKKRKERKVHQGEGDSYGPSCTSPNLHVQVPAPRISKCNHIQR